MCAPVPPAVISTKWSEAERVERFPNVRQKRRSATNRKTNRSEATLHYSFFIIQY